MDEDENKLATLLAMFVLAVVLVVLCAVSCGEQGGVVRTGLEGPDDRARLR